MKVQSTSIGLLAFAVAIGAGVLERDRILRPTRAAPREAVAPLPPVRPNAAAAEPAGAAPTAVASLQPAAPPTSAAPVPPIPPAPAAPPARMTLAQQADFDSWMVKTYLGCWKPAAQPADSDTYIAKVRLAFRPDGSLKKPPKLVNPPSDPAAKPQAKSVMQAVRACNPLPVPAQYRPFYEQWKTKTIHFNPQIAAR
jgi:hypothetical protein